MFIYNGDIMNHRSFLGKFNKYKKLSVRSTAPGQGASDSEMLCFVKGETMTIAARHRGRAEI